MSKDPPTLEHMEYEHGIVYGALDLIQKRHERGERFPPDMHHAFCKFAEAYLQVIKEFFPEEMNSQYQQVADRLDLVEPLYKRY
tara:strand:- start:83 stop:334 length:252 start_codon:yes stop_codon:yes gene_type:complete